MRLDDLVVIGPGSEWFWAMAQFVAVVVTLVAIYRQLKAQGSANALSRLEALSTRWNSRRLVLARLHTAIELRHGSGPVSADHAMNHVLDFFIDLDNLYLKGHITLDEIDWNWGTSLRVWHALTLDAMEAERQRTGDPALADDLDRLVARIEARARQRGASAIVIDAETRNGWLDEAIRRNTEILELLNEAEGHAIPKAPSGVVA